ncbi:hypothetical protein F6Q07_21530 [Pectobacterium parmentieri]|nr:hypothetical protein [Pectobacterium parmentieri]MBI0432072.1 hypothetical protein [Pectobacterium parmentieri]MBI0520680.1 hypothetical protein [Pectobacterium parmentieri]MBI0552755.1 hypothetical protein [Pectobacterium parmentieri]MBI0561778.1 hypothetical protein [Pectobacterium parmentieri]MBI0566056.1 hypothetical protein [Pectobacterium parmentieri]
MMEYFGYLVAVPQVVNIILRLVAAFANTSPEWIVTVEPAFSVRHISYPSLVKVALTISRNSNIGQLAKRNPSFIDRLTTHSTD